MGAGAGIAGHEGGDGPAHGRVEIAANHDHRVWDQGGRPQNAQPGKLVGEVLGEALHVGGVVGSYVDFAIGDGQRVVLVVVDRHGGEKRVRVQVAAGEDLGLGNQIARYRERFATGVAPVAGFAQQVGHAVQLGVAADQQNGVVAVRTVAAGQLGDHLHAVLRDGLQREAAGDERNIHPLLVQRLRQAFVGAHGNAADGLPQGMFHVVQHRAPGGQRFGRAANGQDAEREWCRGGHGWSAQSRRRRHGAGQREQEQRLRKQPPAAGRYPAVRRQDGCRVVYVLHLSSPAILVPLRSSLRAGGEEIQAAWCYDERFDGIIPRRVPLSLPSPRGGEGITVSSGFAVLRFCGLPCQASDKRRSPRTL